MGYIIGYLIIVFLIPIVAASLTICAPKWYEEQDSQGRIPHPIRKLNKWMALVLQGLRLLVVIVCIPTVFAIWLSAMFITSGVALIERACPYTHSRTQSDTFMSVLTGPKEGLRATLHWIRQG